MTSARRLTALAAAAALTAGAVGATVVLATASGAVTPSRFDAPRANPYFPLQPGTVTRYRGTDEGQHYTETVVVTHRTKMIQGVRTRVVTDVLRRTDGSLAEKTADWYAGDHRGNVWYFGEDTATYDAQGRLEDREGSWRAGRGGAVPGMIMPAHPHPSRAYRQEYDRGDAEDQAWIVQRGSHVRVPAGRFGDVVRTFEWSRLEPGVISQKLYAPGVGIVRERDLKGGSEAFSLVSVTHR